MVKNEILDKLFEVRRELTEKVVLLSPGKNRARIAQMRRLVSRLDDVNATINLVIATAFHVIGESPELKQASDKLDAATVSLSGLEDDISKVNTAISLAGEVIQVVIAIVKLVA